jgi:hypothetical protein
MKWIGAAAALLVCVLAASLQAQQPRLREDASARQAGDDEFNKRLMVEVQRDGDSYLSNATINGRFALRACIVNFRTTAADVERLLDTIRRVAARMT